MFDRLIPPKNSSNALLWFPDITFQMNDTEDLAWSTKIFLVYNWFVLFGEIRSHILVQWDLNFCFSRLALNSQKSPCLRLLSNRIIRISNNKRLLKNVLFQFCLFVCLYWDSVSWQASCPATEYTTKHEWFQTPGPSSIL